MGILNRFNLIFKMEFIELALSRFAYNNIYMKLNTL